MTETTAPDPTGLREQWDAFSAEHPKVRIREAAARLGVAEAQLLATYVGETVIRLRPEWADLVTALGMLGPVVAHTRNGLAVHELTGEWQPAQLSDDGRAGSIVGDVVDLRLFLSRWHSVFAVVEPRPGRESLRSVEIFDAYGQAIHKLRLTPGSNVAAFDSMISRYASDEQTRRHETEPAPSDPEAAPDDTIDRYALLAAWSHMTDTHQFHGLLREHGTTRTQALRLAAGDFTEALEPSAFRALLGQAVALKQPMMAFVGNRGVIQIFSGVMQRLTEVAGAVTASVDGTFSLQLTPAGVAEAWLVRKPTGRGLVTSVELYDSDGREIALFFSHRERGQEETLQWRDITATLPRLHTA